jgi:Tfp pilus assembly major pilin PilA
MRALRKRQQGVTLIGWAIILGLIAFFVLLALRLTPSYMEYFAVKGVMDSLQEESKGAQLTPKEVRDLFDKRADVNAITVVTSKDLVFTNKGGKKVITLDYEARKPIMGNVDAVMTFHREAELRQ